MKRLLPALPLCALLVLALFEVVAHVRARGEVAPLSDWQAAARFVRKALAPRDALAAAPDYADPLLRQVLGDAIDLAMAGRSDLAGYERLWVLSLGDAVAREARGRTKELQAAFGRVTVRRYALGPSRVLYDFTRRAREAEVQSGALPCALRTHRPPRGGGLGFGALPPVERFACPGGAWVAAVVQEDLALQPRHCVRAGVSRGRPLRMTFSDVPLGEQLVLYNGLYYEDERMRQGAPVEARVRIGERELGRTRHVDGDGWKRDAWRTPGGRAAVSIEVTTTSARARSYCFAASTRAGAQGASP